MDSLTGRLTKPADLKFRANLILFSQTRKCSVFEMYLLFLISYLQIFFMSTRFMRDHIIGDSSSLHYGIKFLEDIITVDNLFEYSEDSKGLLAAFSVTSAYFLILMTTFLLLSKAILTIRKPMSSLTIVWTFIMRFHSPVMFFIINNICCRVQEQYIYKREGTFDSTVLQVLFFFSLAITFINTAIALVIEILLSNSLPSKDLLSTKNAYTDQITVYQKLILTFFWRFLPSEPLTRWILVILNLGLSLIKQCLYYRTFPRYRFTALNFNAYMLAVEASIVYMTPLIFLLNMINNVRISVSATIMMIVLLLPFMIFCIREIINKSLKKILCSSLNQLNSQKLIHKLISFKLIKAFKDHPGKEKMLFNINGLRFAGIVNNREMIFNEGEIDFHNDNFHNKEVQKHIIRQYLDRIEKRFPRDNLLKLIRIKFYGKTLKLFPRAIANLTNVKSFSPIIKVTKDILFLKIHETILKHSKEDDSLLSMCDYLSTVSQVEDFQEKINHQLDLEKQFWIEYLNVNPDTSKLYTLSEKVEAQKKLIQAQWEKSKFNSKYSQPFLLYTYYLFNINESPAEARKCINNYFLRNQGMREHDYSDLSQSNLYSEDTFYLTLKTDSKYIGTVVKCSQSVQKVLYYDSKSLINTNINKLMTDYIGINHNRFIQKYLSTGESRVLNRIRVEFTKDRLGFLHRTWLYAKFHPDFDQEIYLTAIIKPIRTYQEFILVTPKGLVDGSTSGIAKTLGILLKNQSIMSICKEFEEINYAFNYFAYKHLGINIDSQNDSTKAESLLSVNKFNEKRLEDVYKKWNSEGGNLNFLTSSAESKKYIVNPNTKIRCFCQIQNYYFAKDFMKLIIIHKINGLTRDELNSLKNIKSMKSMNYFEKTKTLKTFTVSQNELKENNGGIARQKSQAIFKSNFAGIDEKSEFEDINLVSINNLNPGKEFESEKKIVDEISPKNVSASKFNSSDEIYHEDLEFLRKITELEPDVTDKKTKQELNNPLRLLNAKHDPQIAASIAASSSAGITKKGRIHDGIVEVLSRKEYTRKAYILLLFVCCFGATIFSIQLALHFKVKNDLETLEALGTTLDQANTAVDALTYLSRGARISFLGESLIIDIVRSSLANEYVKAFKNILGIYLPILKAANNGLWAALQKIDENFRNELLGLDIEFLDFNQSLTNETTRMVNTFIGTTLLENKLYHIKMYLQQYGKYELIDLLYVMRNSCGSLLVKNKKLAEMVLRFIDVSITDQQTSLDIYFGLCLFFVCMGLIIVIGLSWKFYNVEVKGLRHFIRISEQEVNTIQEVLYQFKNALKFQEYKNFTNLAHASTIMPEKEKSKTLPQIYKGFRSPNTSTLKKKYLLKMLYWILIVSSYMGFMVLTYKKAYENGSNFKLGINRLLMVQKFLDQVQLSMVGFYALFIPQYEPIAEGVPTLTMLKDSLVSLSESSITLTNTYKLIDGTLDPAITPTFSGNVCDFVTVGNLQKCLVVAAGSQSKNLFSFIGTLYSEVSYDTEAYLQSDQTPESAQSICTAAFIRITPIISSVRDVLLYMIGQARINFNQTYQKLMSQLTSFLVINVLLFWSLVLLAWIYVMRYLMEYNQRLK